MPAVCGVMKLREEYALVIERQPVIWRLLPTSPGLWSLG